jgi:hypothetical protein
MAEKNEYEVKAVNKKTETVEAIVDKKIGEESPPSQQPQVLGSAAQPSKMQRRGFQIPQIPTQKIFKTLTDREMMVQTLHDETMEPHVHLIILLFIVFILAIIIALIGI